MTKALFADFYGTLVHEDGEVIRQITKIILDTGKAGSTSEIDAFWWADFQSLFMQAYGDSFETQRVLEEKSIVHTLERFSSDADAAELSGMLFAQWVKPPVFGDAKEFLAVSPVPVYIVSNIDTSDIMQAVGYHGLKPAGIFTSEEARAYKPRRELFELALRETGLKPEEVIHIGDSLGSDVRGASALGIRALWLNRSGREVPGGVEAISSLKEAFGYLS